VPSDACCVLNCADLPFVVWPMVSGSVLPLGTRATKISCTMVLVGCTSTGTTMCRVLSLLLVLWSVACCLCQT
jgi:hypothetical protein